MATKAKRKNSYTKLQSLTKWYKVKDVNNMLMAGESPRKVAMYCCQWGFDISESKMYEYRRVLQSAIGKQISVERLLGVNAPRENPMAMQVMMESNVKNLVRSEMEVLDAIIQKGNAFLRLPDTEVEIKDMIKAIELKHKITGGAHGGLTGYGIDKLKEMEKTKMEAMLDVIGKYLDGEQMEELYEEVSTAEREFYKIHAPEMLEEYDEMIQETMDATESDDILSEDAIPLTDIEDGSKVIDVEEDGVIYPYCVKCNDYVKITEDSPSATRCPICGTLLTLKTL